MPTRYSRVFIDGVGSAFPGEPIPRHQLDRYVAPAGSRQRRIQQSVLRENGIETRHLAIDESGETTMSHADLAAQAVRAALSDANATLDDLGLLAVGSSGGDALVPGFAQLVQGSLSAPPMSTLSSLGVCAAGVVALEHAAASLEMGTHERASVVGVDMPSRLFKNSRFAPDGRNVQFDSHFLRWMLSDAAGALILSTQGARPTTRARRLRLQLKWVHQKSFAGDYPSCMMLGLHRDKARSYLDAPSLAAAEAEGAFSLRQDIRLLPHLFDVSIHEYVGLVKEGWVDPERIDHFLCHYSSKKFEGVVEELLERAGLGIDKSRWYSNLRTRGNTGAASIFVMLEEFLRARPVHAGETILCFVPESARIAASYFLLEVTEDTPRPTSAVDGSFDVGEAVDLPLPDAPHAPPEGSDGSPTVRRALLELAGVWHEYRSAVWRTRLVERIKSRTLTRDDYLAWMEHWIPQVRVGTSWMREAVLHLGPELRALADLITRHAGDEQDDFQLLYRDYQELGGQRLLDSLRRNPGGEALHAYLKALSQTQNPVGLLGATYVIEGTGQRIIPALLPLLQRQLALPPGATRFLQYHGQNDGAHLARWLKALRIALEHDPQSRHAIADVARRTSQLYLMQWEHLRLG